jgi:putative heme transporter
MTALATSPGPARRARRWLLGAALISVGGLEAYLFAPYAGRAFDRLIAANVGWILIAIVAEACSMAAFARVQRRMLTAGGTRVSMPRMVALTYAANAVSVTLPAGLALSAGYAFSRLRSWGATAAGAGFALAASGLLSTVSFALIAVVVAVFIGGGASTWWLLVAVAVAVALTVVTARHRPRMSVVTGLAAQILMRVNRLLHRPRTAGVVAVRRFAADITAIRPRTRDWVVALTLAVVNWIADVVCLYASCEAVGLHIPTAALALSAYLAGIGAGTISILPAGLGVTDAAMIVVLAGSGGAGIATAGVLVYRVISFALVVAAGWLIWIGWYARRRKIAPADLVSAELVPTAPVAVTE